VPVHVYQLDPWWLPCGTGADGGSPLDWTPGPTSSRGLAPLAAAGMRLLLYGAYWALPPANRLANSSWAVSELMTEDLPRSEAAAPPPPPNHPPTPEIDPAPP
jgi:hypothetical protein